MTAGALALIAACVIGLCLGAHSARREQKRMERLYLDLLATTERDEVLDGAELERRVLAFRREIGRAL